MAFYTMYPSLNNSPYASLTEGITATDSSITVDDASALPEGPNILTIGTDETAELVRYSSISGNVITGCERGFNNTTARMWASDTLVFRGFTDYDFDAFVGNINHLNENKSNRAILLTAFLSADGWSDSAPYTQTVAVEGIALSGFAWVVAPVPGNHEEYCSCGIRMEEPNQEGYVTFTAKNVPSSDLSANIMKVEVI